MIRSWNPLLLWYNPLLVGVTGNHSSQYRDPHSSAWEQWWGLKDPNSEGAYYSSFGQHTHNQGKTHLLLMLDGRLSDCKNYTCKPHPISEHNSFLPCVATSRSIQLAQLPHLSAFCSFNTQKALGVQIEPRA